MELLISDIRYEKCLPSGCKFVDKECVFVLCILE